MTEATLGPVMNGPKDNRITSLDGLRALAVLFVISFHYINNQVADNSWLINRFGTPAVILQRLTYFGWTGVNLFFILSGFLIGNILLKNKNSSHYFKTFYIRRFCRIIPAYYLLLIVFTAIKSTPYFDPGASIFEHPVPLKYYFLFVQNFSMASFNTFGPQALTPTWSLCVEEQFYLIIPFLVLFIPSRYAWIMVVAGCTVAIISRHMSTNFYQGYVLLPSRIDSPMIGFLLAWLHQKEGYRLWIVKNMKRVYVALLIFLIACGALFVWSDPGIYSHTLLGVLFALIVIICLYSEQGILIRFLSLNLLVRIGKLSYFIYLFHQIINGYLQLAVLHRPAPSLDGFPSLWLTAGSFVLTCLLAMVSFKWLEEPVIKYSHKFRY